MSAQSDIYIRYIDKKYNTINCTGYPRYYFDDGNYSIYHVRSCLTIVRFCHFSCSINWVWIIFRKLIALSVSYRCHSVLARLVFYLDVFILLRFLSFIYAPKIWITHLLFSNFAQFIFGRCSPCNALCQQVLIATF